MKRYLLSIIFLLAVSFVLNAQNFTVSPNPSYGSADLDDPESNPDDVVAYASITNHTSDTLFLKWERIFNDKPESWETAICDVNLCYLPIVSTKEFFLPPGLSNGDMLVHVYPAKEPGGIPQYGAIPGEAHVKIKVSDVNEPKDTLIIEYFFTVTGSPISDISEVELKKLKIFPNPTTDHFRLTETTHISQLVIYNILGRAIRTFDVNANQSFTISDLPNGVYLVALMDASQKPIKTLRLQKH